MERNFNVAVVIPVYNAAHYIAKAVASALAQPEVSEVVLVEDRSPDNSLQICQELVGQNAKVKLFRHPNGENRGAAASRNLGVMMSSAPYIAFLDADDYYLPNRFSKAAAILAQNSEIDGVYDAIGLHIYSEQGLGRYETYKGRKMDPAQLITIKRPVSPEKLFDSLVLENLGIFHANGITVRRDFLLDIGLFDEDLDIVEDTVLWLKLAYHGNLAAGSLSEPVARQGIHDLNREPNMRPELLYQKYHRLFNYFVNKPVNKAVLRAFFVRMISYHPKRKFFGKRSLYAKLGMVPLVFGELIRHPAWAAKLFV